MAAKLKCKHPKLDSSRRCKDCRQVIDIRAKRNKYGAKRVDCFDSQKEARRYRDLQLMQDAGEITALTVHPEFHLIVNGEEVCIYEADSLYWKEGRRIVEDVKSEATRTAAYKIKKKLMHACLGITVQEV